MPKKVAKKIISLQYNFFWGVKDGGRAIPLVKWELLQKPKRLDGLGDGDLVMKNAVLLFKWLWRFSTEENPLWKRVVVSCNRLN